MATRRQVREAVVSLLYSYDLGNIGVLDSAYMVFDEKKIRNAQREFGVTLLEGVLANIEQLDASIITALDDRGMDGIGSIEKAVLRLGAYEITHAMSDRAVIINEAVEISKLLGAENSAKFVNGVLDAVKAGEAI
jgi:transcription antitermination protein NusB